MRTHLGNVGLGLAFILDCLRRRLFSVQAEQTAANFVVGHDRLPSWLKATRSVIRATSTFLHQFPNAKQSFVPVSNCETIHRYAEGSPHNQSKNCTILDRKAAAFPPTFKRSGDRRRGLEGKALDWLATSGNIDVARHPIW